MIQDELKEFVKENYSEKKEVIALYDIIKILNEGRFVNKENLLASLISFISFNDNFINAISKGLILGAANLEGYKKIANRYNEQAPPMEELINFAEEIEDALTQRINKNGEDIPEYSKSCLEALISAHVRHEEEIQEIINNT